MTAETHPIEPELVMAYLDGELSPDEAARVAQHLDQCKECADTAAALRSVSAQAMSWNVEEAPKRISHEVLAALHSLDKAAKDGAANSESAWKKRDRPSTFSWKALARSKWAWAAAGFVVLCVIGLSIQPLHRNAVMSRLASREAAQLAMNNALISDSLERESAPSEPAYKMRAALPAVPAQSPNAEAPPSGPMIARTASLNISVKDFDAARISVDRIVRARQGYLSSLNISTEQGAPRSLDAKLAVPAAQCDAALGELRALGQVTQEQQGSEEISAQIVDLDARLRNARETETQLAEILRARTGKVGDVLEVEKEMSRVRGEIEVMEADQKQLRTRVAFSTIDLNLAEEYKAQLGDTSGSVFPRMRNAVVDGFHSAADGLLNVFLFLLRVGPSLLLLALALFVPVRFAWRRWRRAHGG
jgi:hypothetical protein